MHADPSRRDAVTFRTRIDLWLILLLAVSFGGSIVASVVALDPALPGTWVPLLIMLGTVLLVGLVSVPTEYTLSDRELLVRFGIFRRTIPLSSIERAYPSRNPISSPAWSLDRIAIHYREGRSRRFALISPVRRDEFMNLLSDRARLQESPRGLVPITPRD